MRFGKRSSLRSEEGSIMYFIYVMCILLQTFSTNSCVASVLLPFIQPNLCREIIDKVTLQLAHAECQRLPSSLSLSSTTAPSSPCSSLKRPRTFGSIWTGINFSPAEGSLSTGVTSRTLTGFLTRYGSIFSFLFAQFAMAVAYYSCLCQNNLSIFSVSIDCFAWFFGVLSTEGTLSSPYDSFCSSV